MVDQTEPPKVQIKPFNPKIQGSVTPPPEFFDRAGGHRKSVLASTVLLVVLMFATKIEPELLGVEVPRGVLWIGLAIGHLYVFFMWRLTTKIEDDSDNALLNPRGLLKQAFARGTKGFGAKRIAQHLFIYALPIWAFLVGAAILVWKGYVAFR